MVNNPPEGRQCRFENCARPIRVRGLCDAHYQQEMRGVPLTEVREWRKGGSTGTCEVAVCERPKFAKGYCAGHWHRNRTGGDMESAIEEQRRGGGTGGCVEDGCARRASSRYRCSVHADLHRKGLPSRPVKDPVEPRTRFVNEAGYVVIRVPGHPTCHRGYYAFEHRYVMSEHLGRPLTSEENVHHLNGDRADNRIENLELWSRSQPPGQRVADKVRWARQLLEQYAEEFPDA